MSLNGTWKVTGGGGGAAVGVGAGAVAAAAIWSVIVALLWVIVITVAVLLVLAVVGVVMLRRRYPDYSPSLAEQAAGARAAMAAPSAQSVIENHYHQHLHLAPGETAEGIKWPAIPLRDAVTEIRED